MPTHVVRLHPIFIKVVEPLSSKTSKSIEERIAEMYIKDYITKTQYFEMMKRVKECK